MADQATWVRGGAVAAAGLVVAVVYAGAGGFRGPDRMAAAQTPSPAATATASNVIAVSGLGKVAGTPDTLLLQLRVESRGADVTAALNAANSAVTKMVAALKAKGVAARDIKTSGLSVQPDYRYEKETQRLIGYIASQSMSVKLHDLNKAGAAVSAATEAGGNSVRIDGASLDLDSDSDLVVAARASAFAEAKAKAEQYAKLAGRGLRPVSSVTESVSNPPVPTPYNMSAAATDAKLAAVPIQPGSQQVEVRVEVVWALN
jgi:uncharacterized protein YggE